MKNRFKMMIILITILFITGCTVNYNVVINDKRKITETTNFIVDNKFFKDQSIGVDEYLSGLIKSYQSFEQFNQYNISKKKGFKTASLITKRRFSDFNNYVSSPIYINLFESGEIIEDNDKLTFKTTGEYYYSDFFTAVGDLNKQIPTININIRFYNEVEDHNADKVNKLTNTYTWHVTPDDISDKQIIFTINNKVKYDIIIIDFLINNSTKIMVSFVTVLIILLTTLYFKRNYKKNNEI